VVAAANLVHHQIVGSPRKTFKEADRRAEVPGDERNRVLGWRSSGSGGNTLLLTI
jgi:hypothetical protein